MKKKIMWHLAGRKTRTQSLMLWQWTVWVFGPLHVMLQGFVLVRLGGRFHELVNDLLHAVLQLLRGFLLLLDLGLLVDERLLPAVLHHGPGVDLLLHGQSAWNKGHKWEQLYIMITMLQVLIKCLLHSQSVRKMGNKEEQVYRMPTMLQVLMMCLLYGQTVWKGNRCEKTTANDNMFQAIKMYKIILLIGNQWVCQQCFSV